LEDKKMNEFQLVRIGLFWRGGKYLMIFWCPPGASPTFFGKKIVLEYFRMNLQFPDKAGFTLR
jgi:hypothetical protein